jgi:hypothetical protein
MMALLKPIVRRGLRVVVIIALVGIVAQLPPSAFAGTVGPFGHVRGQLEVVGGVAPGSARGVSGRVVLTRVNSFGSFTYPTNSHGSFDFNVPPGTYVVTGFSPKVVANGKQVRCAAAHTIHVAPPDAEGMATVAGVRVECNVK